MPGSPIKRARKMGLDIPNLGSRPPRGLSPRGRPRTGSLAAVDPNRPLEPDGDLHAIAKRVLRNTAEGGIVERNRIGAAKALAEVTRPREKVQNELSVTLHSLTGEQLDALVVKAKHVLEEPAP